MNNFTAFIFGALLAIILVGYVFLSSGEKQDRPVMSGQDNSSVTAPVPNQSNSENEIATPAASVPAPTAEDESKADTPKSDDPKTVDAPAPEAAISSDSQAPEVQTSDDTNEKVDNSSTDAASSQMKTDSVVEQPQAETAK